MTAALDGSTTAQHAASTAPTTTITTTKKYDVILVWVVINNVSDTVSSITCPGCTTFAQRKREAGSASVSAELWWAVAALPLSAATVTVNLSASIASTISVFGVSGCDPASPFDPNAALPAVGTATSTAPSASITTTNADDFLICCMGTTSTQATITKPSAMTLIGSQGTTAPSGGTAYEVVSATQSAVAFTWTVTTSRVWVAVADALMSAALGAGTSSAVGTAVASGKGSGAGTAKAVGTGVGSGKGAGSGLSHTTATGGSGGKGTGAGLSSTSKTAIGSGKGAGAGVSQTSKTAVGSGLAAGGGLSKTSKVGVGSGHGSGAPKSGASATAVGSGKGPASGLSSTSTHATGGGFGVASGLSRTSVQVTGTSPSPAPVGTPASSSGNIFWTPSHAMAEVPALSHSAYASVSAGHGNETHFQVAVAVGRGQSKNKLTDEFHEVIPEPQQEGPPRNPLTEEFAQGRPVSARRSRNKLTDEF